MHICYGNDQPACTRRPASRPSTRRERGRQFGQDGYPNGRLNNGRYELGNLHDASDANGLPIPSEVGKGGNGAIVPDDNNLPGLAGGTYVTRKLGIKNLRDVPCAAAAKTA
jgi:hypothetical protein